MAETGRNKSQLAEYLGVSKGYVSQLLNGDYDHCMSKFFELALAFGMVRKEKRIVPIVSIVFFKKKQEGEKQPSCSALYARHEHCLTGASPE